MFRNSRKSFIFFIILITTNVALLNYVTDSDEDDEGPVATIAPRIVGGVDSNINRIPAFVQIYFLVAKFPFLLCGATLLTPTCLLTAGHCFSLSRSLKLYAEAGSDTPLTPDDQRESNIIKTYIHPLYNGTKYAEDADVAIFKLNTPLVGRNIQTVQIDYSELNDGDFLTVYGLGLTKHDNEKGSSRLQQVDVFARPFGPCAASYEKKFPVRMTDRMFCAGAHGGGRDACSSDSGGPIMRDGRQVGIVSFGYKCALPDFPGVYTKLSNKDIRSFIETTKNEHCL